MTTPDADGRVTAMVVLKNKNGLHARPAHLFVQTANRFASELWVGRNGVEKVNGKSIMGIMMLAAECGVQLELEAAGADASEQVAALIALVGEGFGEP